MKLTTTLNLLRKHAACSHGYETLLDGLGRDWPDDRPIGLDRILEINGLEDALWALRATEQNCDREARLMAADFSEEVLHVWETAYPFDDRPRKAIQAARSFALGKLSGAAWSAAWSASKSAASAARYAAASASESAAWSASRSAAWSAARYAAARYAAASASDSAAWSAARSAASAAWSASESAAWSASESAARSAAEAARYAAARYAARSASDSAIKAHQIEIFLSYQGGSQ